MTQLSTPEAERDLLGRLRLPYARAWQSAVTAFQHHSVFLADAAQTLVRLADVDIPALRDASVKLTVESRELARKETLAVRTAKDARARFVTSCTDLGLSEREMKECKDFTFVVDRFVKRKMPEIVQDIVNCGKRLHEVVEEYQRFAQMHDADVEGKGVKVCPTVRELLNADSAELVRPVDNEDDGENACAEDKEEDAGENDKIDWDMDKVEVTGDVDAGADAGIDWGLEIETTQEAAATGESGGTADGIDWGIEVDGAGSAVGDATSTGDNGDSIMGKVIEDEKMKTKDKEETVRELRMWRAVDRARYQHELCELWAFVKRRGVEVGRTGAVDVAVRGLVSKRCSAQTKMEMVLGWETLVKDAMRTMSDGEAGRVLSLEMQEGLRERTAKELMGRRGMAERLERSVDMIRERRRKVMQESESVRPRMKEVVERTRWIVQETERALSEMYNGRQVNIVGEIGRVLASGS